MYLLCVAFGCPARSLSDGFARCCFWKRRNDQTAIFFKQIKFGTENTAERLLVTHSGSVRFCILCGRNRRKKWWIIRAGGKDIAGLTRCYKSLFVHLFRESAACAHLDAPAGIKSLFRIFFRTSFRQILPVAASKILARHKVCLRIFSLSPTKSCSKIRT